MTSEQAAGLTSEEASALALTVQLWNALVSLPSMHPDDVNDFRQDIHRIQDRIASRTTYRRLGSVMKRAL